MSVPLRTRQSWETTARPICNRADRWRKSPNTEPTKTLAYSPDRWKGELTSIDGSKSDEWNNLLANQAMRALWLKNSDAGTRHKQMSATIAALVGIEPKDELEGMMAAQLIAAHNAAMECYPRSDRPCEYNEATAWSAPVRGLGSQGQSCVVRLPA